MSGEGCLEPAGRDEEEDGDDEDDVVVAEEEEEEEEFRQRELKPAAVASVLAAELDFFAPAVSPLVGFFPIAGSEGNESFELDGR